MKTTKILDFLFGRKAALLYILLFAIAVGGATFVENDYGTDSAQKVIYQAAWFELLLLLFSGALIKNIIDFRLIPRKMWAVLSFHVAIIVILIGAGVTRFFGYEGMMHIREGEMSNQFLSSEGYVKLHFNKEGKDYYIDEPVLWSSLGGNEFQEQYQIGADIVKIKLKESYINPQYSVVSEEGGEPILKLVFGSAQGRNEYYLTYNSRRFIGGVPFYFGPGQMPDAFSLSLNAEGEVVLYSSQPYSYMRMADRSLFEMPADTSSPLALRSLYQWGDAAFVFGDYIPSGKMLRSGGDLKIQASSSIGLVFEVRYQNSVYEQYIEGFKGSPGKYEALDLGPIQLEMAYGSKVRELPFSIKLYDFQMERYPGTNSPASYASEVQVVDPMAGKSFDFRIYMNHILNYGGFRFFQSSYDRDELGTYLSVNNDFWGTWISYFGYALLTIGMLWTLVSKNTRFAQLAQQIKAIRAKRAALSLILLLGMGSVSAQTDLESNLPAVSKEHADLFSTVLVQDIRGRMKPMHTLTREVMRKLLGKESYRGLSADQVVLSVWADNSNWYGEPMIKLPFHPKWAELGFTEEVQPYKAFFNPDGSYKLTDEVSAANAVIDKEKGTWEKALLKLDEKVNVFNMMLSGYVLKIVPMEGDENNTWVSDYQHGEMQSIVADRLFPAYADALQRGMESGDYSLANGIITELKKYQDAQDPSILPSANQRKLEIFLNNLKVFNRLALVYTLLGLAFLVTLFLQVFQPKRRYAKLHLVLLSALFLAFAFHTLGLGLRWYVSGRAPWSNGYESMIYIAWTGTLAGLLFSRKSSGALAATNVLSGVVLLIAMLSYLNPEITPLVPVLRSYWLTIHVSLEAGSYGFLMLGALIGVINLLLMVFLSDSNKARVRDIVSEMTKLSEMTLIGGLFMLSIGTYLGGVWANESWGRYWGWDAKETWALVSILVYAFILHMRFVPGLKGAFAFNFASLFGLASIIMTYYGVNYYLSGLHSYAAGDPVPVPGWVYYSVAGLLLLSALAYWRQKVVWRK